ncbi:hypothetical protein ACFO25_01025 [Paenactinomyces guangxiensis]|uniref:Uncharacterized protein n=1 Tax=Paenactinomyces guangxiensis TaxID=1490290 RepID=A0A7W1WSQ0_9BACL|nr:hypothetical protein [Paenactinomyces guangxiensis]MBA4495345.1 hypothetical protein [Paenactinomyces guangxiensis]MBH8592534.1 hypothetical protein [Paenactinomyces guangxiensis]
MARLEYRLLDEANGFPLLYTYENISKEEIALRFACDYFVKDHKVFEKTSCAVESLTHIIYVVRNYEEKVTEPGIRFAPQWKGIRMEVRHLQEETNQYPIIHTYHFHQYQDALLYLMSHFLYFDGKEWEKTSTEVDENRKVYVCYAQPAST